MYGFNIDETDYSAAPASTAPAGPKFKVGDRVRFTDLVEPRWFFKAGETGVVETAGVGDNLNIIVACDDHDGELAYVDAEHIELLVPAQPKFKVGDRVRVIKDGDGIAGSGHGAEIGYEDTIIAVAADDYFGRPEGEAWFYNPDEIELVARAEQPKFNVGDRVKVLVDEWSPDVKIGDFGTIHRLVDDRGVTVKIEGGDGFDWFFKFDQVAAALAPQAQHFNSGDKVRVTKHSGYFAAGDTGEVDYQTDSMVYVTRGPWRTSLPILPECLELIAEPEAGNKGQMKFKAGDVVRCLSTPHTEGQFTKGKTYTVLEDVPDDGKTYVRFARDDRGNKNGWCQKYFELAADSTTASIHTLKLEVDTSELTEALGKLRGPCIVARVLDGTPRPSNIPYVHADVASATAEAERLARNNPGQEFAVYQRVAGRVAEVSYEMKEVA